MWIFDPFKSREGWLLFITLSSDIRELYYKYFHSFGIHLNTLAKITPCLLCLELISKPCPIILSPFTGAPPKSEHFWTFLTLTSYSNHLNLNQMSLNLNFEKWHSIFLGSCTFFASPGILSACPNSYSNLLSSLFLSIYFFVFLKKGNRREERDQQAGH